MRSLNAESCHRKTRAKYSFRAFYITVLCISAFALLSTVAHQSAHYRHGSQYRVVQRQALGKLDITRLVKRDEEACKILQTSSKTLLTCLFAVSTGTSCTRQMRVHQSQLSRRRSWSLLLPLTILLQSRKGSTCCLHYSYSMAWTLIYDNWHCSQRLLLHKSQYHCIHSWNERKYGGRNIFSLWKRQS
jgi:hypothetical protein